MKYFITGSSGFLGTHLRERLLTRNADTYLYARDQDLSVLEEFQPDYIYHLAGEIYNEEEMYESNSTLTYRLLETARKLPIKAFIYVGSSSEYGRKDHPIAETDYLSPSTLYEATKACGSLLCQAYAREFNTPVMIARPFSLYGKHEPWKRFIPTVIHHIKRKKTIHIAPGVHDFIHVDDFINGLFLLEQNVRPGEVFNFGTGIQTSNEDLVSMVEKAIGKSTEKKLIGKIHSYDSDCWVCDNSKARELGWEPKFDLIRGLTQVIKEENVRN